MSNFSMPERSSIVKNYFRQPIRRPLPFSKDKRYAPKAMTVCSAVIAHDVDDYPMILMVADMRLSWDYDSIDTAHKIYRVHPKWLFSFATESTQAADRLLIDLPAALKGKKALPEIQTAAQGVWQKYPKWEFLFAGFDRGDSPHIFRIDDEGICTRDLERFGSVGSGKFLANAFLGSYPYSAELSYAESIYCILAAKFTAERAGGVGPKTTLARLDPQEGMATSVPDDAVPTIEGRLVDAVRARWETLPRIPEGALAEIEQYLNRFGLPSSTPLS